MVYIRISSGALEILKVLTENDVTLGSGGVGWATGYQDYHKTYLGVARITHNDVWGTLEAFPRLSSVFFVNFTVLELYRGRPKDFL